jgi:hypothetical protein
MLWIRDEEVCFKSGYASVAQRCREFDLDGICDDVRREDPKAPPPFLSLFSAWLCARQWPGCLWMERNNTLQLGMAYSLVAV